MAIGQDHPYSLGAIEVTTESEVYYFSKGKHGTTKLSRHASTAAHLDLPTFKERVEFGAMTSLAEFGIEFLLGFGLKR